MARLLTIDASVAVKWLVEEPGTDAALALVSAETRFVAPDILFAEVANTLWRNVRQRSVDPAQAFAACERLQRYITWTIPSQDLMSRALQVAIELQHPSYDCFYIACAERHEAVLVTADRRLLDATPDTGFAHLVTPLHA